MAFLLQAVGGVAQAAVCGVATGATLVGTGAAVAYGGVTGDWSAADAGAKMVHQAARDTGGGFQRIGEAAEGAVRSGAAVAPIAGCFMAPPAAGLIGLGAMAALGNPSGVRPAPALGQVALSTGIALATRVRQEDRNFNAVQQACAMASEAVYTPYQSRTGFNDSTHDNRRWDEVRPTDPRLGHDYDSQHIAIFEWPPNHPYPDLIIAARGTSDMADVADDFNIVIGDSPARRTQDFINVAARARATGKWENIYLTGHSLGGTIATYAALYLKMEAIVFNPGAGLPSAWLHSRRAGKVEVHHIRTDPISCLVHRTSQISVHDHKAKLFMDPHTIGQFTP